MMAGTPLGFVNFRLQGLNSPGRLANYGTPGQEHLLLLPRGQFVAWNKLSGGTLDVARPARVF